MSFISKTFGGLNKSYYLRHLFFGFILYALMCGLLLQASKGVIDSKLITAVLMLTVLLLLYPYSRFVYESIVDFILGDHIFFVNPILLLMVKFMTMALCFGFSWIIASIGLIYLYFYHSKQEKLIREDTRE